MINEASKVALKSNESWKILGYFHKKSKEIKEELKKEMSARDRHGAKILDRYEARHVTLLHMRATKEEVITNRMKADLSHNHKEEVEEKDRLIKTNSTNSEEENDFIYANVSKEIDKMSDSPSTNSAMSNNKTTAIVTQQTPTKRRMSVEYPYFQGTKPKSQTKVY